MSIEDKKIKEELIELIGCMHDADPRKERWLSWLEKQGQRPKWSDEDEERLQSCIIALQGKGLMGGVDTMDSKWLKSLKQRIG